MSQDPDYYRTVSLKLSEVLCDIGVNERMILKRRRVYLLMETMFTSTQRLLRENIFTFHFGSRSEGSTTIGLHSDIDTLICVRTLIVIQNWSEWQLGRHNLLMIQDETTSPGYCILQMLRDDEPLPISISIPDHITDRTYTVIRGKVLMKNTCFRDIPLAGSVVNGPASSRQGSPCYADQDYVVAYHCKSWPVEAQSWLVRQGIGKWPSEEMKRYCETTGCFVVPVSSKNSQHEELEWRLSTAQAERCLMFSLNITQLRCYILMKMILKTFINPQFNGALSSYMCKTVLFHCIQNTRSNIWVQSNLLTCLMCCLTVLQNFVREENCPHFILPKNNLMAERISLCNKHKILEILHDILQGEGRALMEIPIDDLGRRLKVKMNMDEAFQYYPTPSHIHTQISTELLLSTSHIISLSHIHVLQTLNLDGNAIVRDNLSNFLSTLTNVYRKMGFNRLEKYVLKLITPMFSSY